MVWGKRLFVGGDYAPYQDKITKLMMGNAPLYRQFIMVSTNSEHDPAASLCYVGVPNELFLAHFDNFEHVEESELPRDITLLVGDSTSQEFKRRFQFTTC
jgi:hypothetical protein